MKRGYEVVSVSGEMELGDDLWSTGELDSLEQSLLVPLENGYLLVVGCSHPGLGKILTVSGRHGHVRSVLGGFHDFDSYDVLCDIDHVCPTHCTRNFAEIKARFPGKFLPGGVGRVLTFPVEASR